ncbi:refilin B isoform X2 [Mobula hypostoma]|uniref:refilin B isoform X2 n=1 Tax=Mobula hypostoma TaxID=723540 RepID=UPI002FC32E17
METTRVLIIFFCTVCLLRICCWSAFVCNRNPPQACEQQTIPVENSQDSWPISPLQDPLITSTFQNAGLGPRLHPLSFGEGVEVDPLPPKEIRYTSSVKYDSDRHYVNNVFLQHTLGVGSCSQTVICVPDCTWRNYKTELKFEFQHKPLRFLSAVIVYPKYAKTVYTTTVDYNCRKATRRFLSSVELEVTDFSSS